MNEKGKTKRSKLQPGKLSPKWIFKELKSERSAPKENKQIHPT
jgi:hypothetical protein